MNHLPKLFHLPPTSEAVDRSIHFSPILTEVAPLESSGVFARMKTQPEGLNEEEAARRLVDNGPNIIATGMHRDWLWRLVTAARNPLVILLVVLAGISFATGDPRAGSVMSLMVALGVMLRFVQEARADAAAEKLKAMMHRRRSTTLAFYIA